MKKLFAAVLACLFWTGVLSAAEVKNVIWVIGDGMGPEIMGFFMQGARYAGLDGYENGVSHLEQMMNKGSWGLYFNNTYDTIVTDSAASATQMATGVRSNPEKVGVAYDGSSPKNLLELAKEKGMAVGVISDAYVTDATPGGFTAHVPARGMKRDIARQQIAFGADVISGGGLKYFNSGENKRLLRQAKSKGYRVAKNKKELAKIKSGKLLGLFSEAGMPLAIEMYKYPQTPSLTEQTEKAVELLEQNKNGFVLMVEAGKIDWAAHANDAGAVLAEMKNLDNVLAFVMKYADEHPDTLVYLSADHDTGLGGFTYYHVGRQNADGSPRTDQGEAVYSGDTNYVPFGIYKSLEKQKGGLYMLQEELRKMPAAERPREYVQKRLEETLGTPVDLSGYEDIEDIPGVFRQLDEKRGIAWATQNHSSSPILSVAYGPEAARFTGVYHNTDILPRLKAALGWSEE